MDQATDILRDARDVKNQLLGMEELSVEWKNRQVMKKQRNKE